MSVNSSSRASFDGTRSVMSNNSSNGRRHGPSGGGSAPYYYGESSRSASQQQPGHHHDAQHHQRGRSNLSPNHHGTFSLNGDAFDGDDDEFFELRCNRCDGPFRSMEDVSILECHCALCHGCTGEMLTATKDGGCPCCHSNVSEAHRTRLTAEMTNHQGSSSPSSIANGPVVDVGPIDVQRAIGHLLRRTAVVQRPDGTYGPGVTHPAMAAALLSLMDAVHQAGAFLIKQLRLKCVAAAARAQQADERVLRVQHDFDAHRSAAQARHDKAKAKLERLERVYQEMQQQRSGYEDATQYMADPHQPHRHHQEKSHHHNEEAQQMELENGSCMGSRSMGSAGASPMSQQSFRQHHHHHPHQQQKQQRSHATTTPPQRNLTSSHQQPPPMPHQHPGGYHHKVQQQQQQSIQQQVQYDQNQPTHYEGQNIDPQQYGGHQPSHRHQQVEQLPHHQQQHHQQHHQQPNASRGSNSLRSSNEYVHHPSQPPVHGPSSRAATAMPTGSGRYETPNTAAATAPVQQHRHHHPHGIPSVIAIRPKMSSNDSVSTVGIDMGKGHAGTGTRNRLHHTSRGNSSSIQSHPQELPRTRMMPQQQVRTAAGRPIRGMATAMANAPTHRGAVSASMSVQQPTSSSPFGGSGVAGTSRSTAGAVTTSPFDRGVPREARGGHHNPHRSHDMSMSAPVDNRHPHDAGDLYGFPAPSGDTQQRPGHFNSAGTSPLQEPPIKYSFGSSWRSASSSVGASSAPYYDPGAAAWSRGADDASLGAGRYVDRAAPVGAGTNGHPMYRTSPGHQQQQQQYDHHGRSGAPMMTGGHHGRQGVPSPGQFRHHG